MEYSRQRAVSDGTLQVLPLSLRYFRREDISVALSDQTIPVWEWLGSINSIRFDTPVPNGVHVTVTRKTQIDKNIHEFDLGAKFIARSMDDDFRQLLFLAQEYSENFGGGVDQAIEDSAEALSTAFEALAAANSVESKANQALANSIAATQVAAAAKTQSDLALTQSTTAIDLYNAMFVANYDAARALTNPPPSIYVSGVTGGRPSGMAGHYTYDPSDVTSADDGGIVLVIGTKRYRRVFNGAIFVDWFGLVPNDAGYDNYSAFNQARLALMAQPRGGILSASPGQYFIGQTLTFPTVDGKSVHISMYGVILSRVEGFSAPLISAGSMLELGGGGWRCDGLTIGGRYQEVALASMVLSWVGGCEMRDVSFISGAGGLNLSNCYAFRGTNLRFQYCNGYGIRSETSCHNMQLTNCMWNSCFNTHVYIVGQVFNLRFQGGDHEGGLNGCYVFEQGGSSVIMESEYWEGMKGLLMYPNLPLVGLTVRGTWIGYNDDNHIWYNCVGGLLEGNEFYSQMQTVDPSSSDFEVAVNSYDGTSNRIRSMWADATLQVGFTASGLPYAQPGFRRNRNGRVLLRGGVNGAVDGPVFILPVGYRPEFAYRIGTHSGSVLIEPDGLVTAYLNGSGFVDLSGVEFTGY